MRILNDEITIMGYPETNVCTVVCKYARLHMCAHINFMRNKENYLGSPNFSEQYFNFILKFKNFTKKFKIVFKKNSRFNSNKNMFSPCFMIFHDASDHFWKKVGKRVNLYFSSIFRGLEK